MNSDIRITLQIFLVFTFLALGDAFFLGWGSDSVKVQDPNKPWAQKLDPQTWSAADYDQASFIAYNPMSSFRQAQGSAKSWPQSLQPPRYYGYEQRKVYSPFSEPAGAPIPISVPLQASLTPVALQHVQLVPCMCPVAPEEADKLMEASQGPYLAQAAPQPQPQQQTKH